MSPEDAYHRSAEKAIEDAANTIVDSLIWLKPHLWHPVIERVYTKVGQRGLQVSKRKRGA